MRFFKILARRKKEKRVTDPRQIMVERTGRHQIQTLMEKGMSFQIIEN